MAALRPSTTACSTETDPTAQVDGFEYRQVYSFVNGRPTVSFKLEYPLHSNVLDAPLVFAPEYTTTETISQQNALDVGGSSGDYASAGDATAITGDIDVIVQYLTDDWTPSAIETLCSKWGSAGNRSWRFQLLTTGHLRFEWSVDGTAITQEDSDNTVSFTDGAGTVRVALDVDNGASDYHIQFYESDDDGVTWSKLNDPETDPFESTFSVVF